MRRCFLALLFSIPLSLSSYSNAAELVLTDAEKQWIKNNPIVSFVGDPDWLPFEAIDKNGNYIGIVADHLALISKYSGLKFKLIPTATWQESLRKINSTNVVMISETSESSLRNRLDFTRSYMSNPIVIVMESKTDFIENLAQIQDKKIALIKNYAYADKIKTTFTDIAFSDVNNVEAGLISITTGENDVFLCTLALCSYKLAASGFHNLRIVGKRLLKLRCHLVLKNNTTFYFLY